MPIKVLTTLVPANTGVVIAGQFVIPILSPQDSNITLTNLASAEDYLGTSARHIVAVDLTRHKQARLVVRKMGTAGSAGSKLSAKYATTNEGGTFTGANWNALGTSAIECAITGTNLIVASSWIDLATGAKADVYVTVTQQGGDGVADPVIGAVSIQVR